MERTPEELMQIVTRFNIHDAYAYAPLFNKTDDELARVIQRLGKIKSTSDIVFDSNMLMRILQNEDLISLLDTVVRERKSVQAKATSEVSIVLKWPPLISTAFILNQLLDLFNKPLTDFGLRKQIVSGKTVTDDGVDLVLRFETLPRSVFAAVERICQERV